jgi:hypothetical protein
MEHPKLELELSFNDRLSIFSKMALIWPSATETSAPVPD